jgi:uncharacterized protein YndB with AHSA1/START domain
MGATTETLVYERTMSVEADPETVWQFFVDPEKLKRWMGIDAQLEPRASGVYRCEVIPGMVASGEFVDVDPPHRLVFTWGWQGNETVPPGSSTIEVELAPEGSGTSLRFVHRDLPDAKAVESHSHGWDHYLDRLELAAAGREAGEDPWVSQPPTM